MGRILEDSDSRVRGDLAQAAQVKDPGRAGDLLQIKEFVPSDAGPARQCLGTVNASEGRRT